MLNVHSQVGWYKGLDAQNRLIPSMEFQTAIKNAYRRMKEPFSPPAFWGDNPCQVHAFDAAPARGQFSAEDRAILHDFRCLLRDRARGRGRRSDVRRHSEETIDAGDAIFSHTEQERKLLDRGQRMFERHANDRRPTTDLDWLQSHAARSAGLPYIPRRDENVNAAMQTAYDGIHGGQNGTA